MLTDKYNGKTVMENVSVKKYPGDLISSDTKKKKNILKKEPINLLGMWIRL